MSGSNPEKSKLIVICGPTAVGKTDLSIELAQSWQTEIISTDSRQFYIEMNAATAKPTSSELSTVKHHFVNSLSIQDEYSAGRFEQDALSVLVHLFEKHRIVFAVGGSGLYVKALTEGLDDFPPIPKEVLAKLDQDLLTLGKNKLALELKEKDPEYHNIVDLDNPQRLIRALSVIRTTDRPFSAFRTSQQHDRPFDVHYIRLGRDRAELYNRINKRVFTFLSKGLIEECEQLLPFRHLKSLQTVGYKEVFDYFDGKYNTREEVISKIQQHTRNYAKRQETWLRKHVGEPIFSPLDTHKIKALVAKLLDR